ncbi:MAG: hypothetical protein Q8L47_00550 [bacterium]|nr:hypothetical protein [bacterium]
MELIAIELIPSPINHYSFNLVFARRNDEAIQIYPIISWIAAGFALAMTKVLKEVVNWG